MVDLDQQWAELIALSLAVVGFVMSILFQNPFYSYVSIIIAGIVAGRAYYFKRFKEPILPWILIIAGFLVGYLAGSFWANRFLVLILFALSFGVTYYLHLKKIITKFKSEQFVK